MRILLTFLVGIVSCFYLSDLLRRVLRLGVHSIVGFFLIILGIVLAFFGKSFFYPSLNTLLSVFLLGAGIGFIGYHLMTKSYVVSENLERGFVQKHEDKFIRFLEILPGALTWLAITSPLWLSFALPFAVAYLLIIADAYWLFTSWRISVQVLIGYRRYKKAISQDWLTNLKRDFPKIGESYYHLIVLPTYKETLEVLSPAFEAVANSSYPKKKIFLAVGFEAWADQTQVEEIIKHLQKYKNRIGGVFTTIHELGEGEVKGPGSNRNWMIRNAVKELKKLGIKPSEVLGTTLDADFVIHKDFLSGALHKYLSTPSHLRDKCSYTGVFFYNNNYWQAPSITRLMAAGTAFWQLSEMVGSDKYINFASLSMNLQSLLDIGLWMSNKVNDDSGFYWKAYYHFEGAYKVIPHFLPISADANLDTTLWKTFKNAYLQLKRWAYGVEHMPFIFTQYFKRKDMDFWDKTDKLTFILWSYFKWGTLALFIAFGGLLIPLVNPGYRESALAVNLPNVSSWLLDGAFVGLFSTMFVHEKTVVRRPKDWNIIQIIWSYIQWLLVPIVLITIATIPAIDAQTTLMLGKHLEFRVTNKARSTTTTA